MNPSFEAFVDPPDGFHEKPGTRSNREGQFSPPDVKKKKAAEKKNWGAEKNYWWPKKFLGGSKNLFRRRTP